MRWAFDIDSVITANPEFFRWWIYHLKKSKQEVFIVTARNPKREQETIFELEDWHIPYDKIYFMPDILPRDFSDQAMWKKKKIKELKIDIWVDDNFKIYRRALGISTDIKGVTKIEI